jgi:hypothetical protein
MPDLCRRERRHCHDGSHRQVKGVEPRRARIRSGKDQGSFKLCQSAEDGNHQLAVRRGGIGPGIGQ